jgi:hypothetical protein
MRSMVPALVRVLAVVLLAGALTAGAVSGAGVRQQQPGAGVFGPPTATDPLGPPPVQPEPEQPVPQPESPPADPQVANGPPPVVWSFPPSRAVGLPFAGHLVRGVQLPAWGDDYVTWDPVRKRTPNRGWRRWGTDRLLRRLLGVLDAYRRANPGAPPVLVGDISRPRGGDFGARFGGLGHASHQNGTDVDVYYPRRDRTLRRAWKPSQVDRRLAQSLVNHFAVAGARYVFVGPRLGLKRIRPVVRPLVHHDDHLHFRMR